MRVLGQVDGEVLHFRLLAAIAVNHVTAVIFETWRQLASHLALDSDLLNAHQCNTKMLSSHATRERYIYMYI